MPIGSGQHTADRPGGHVHAHLLRDVRAQRRDHLGLDIAHWHGDTCPTGTGTARLPREINLVQRIVGDVAVGIDALGAPGVADQRIDGQEPSEARIVEARVVVNVRP